MLLRLVAGGLNPDDTIQIWRSPRRHSVVQRYDHRVCSCSDIRQIQLARFPALLDRNNCLHSGAVIGRWGRLFDHILGGVDSPAKGYDSDAMESAAGQKENGPRIGDGATNSSGRL